MVAETFSNLSFQNPTKREVCVRRLPFWHIRSAAKCFQWEDTSSRSPAGILMTEVSEMDHGLPGYLCLTDLLDQDLSAYEYFQTLDPDMQSALRREDGDIGTLDALQSRVEALRMTQDME